MSRTCRAVTALLILALSISAVGGIGTVVHQLARWGSDTLDAASGVPDFPCAGNGCACSDRGYCGDDCCCAPVVVEPTCSHCEPDPPPAASFFVLRARGCDDGEPVLSPSPRPLIAVLSLSGRWVLPASPRRFTAARLGPPASADPWVLDKVPIFSL